MTYALIELGGCSLNTDVHNYNLYNLTTISKPTRAFVHGKRTRSHCFRFGFIAAMSTFSASPVVDLTVVASDCEQEHGPSASAGVAARARISASAAQVLQRWRPRPVRMIQEYTGEIRVAYVTKATRQALSDMMPTARTVWTTMARAFGAPCSGYTIDPFTQFIEEGKMEEYARLVVPMMKMYDFPEAVLDYMWAYATTVKKYYVLAMNDSACLKAYEQIVGEHVVRRTKATESLASIKLVMDTGEAAAQKQGTSVKRRLVEDVWALVKHKIKVVTRHSDNAKARSSFIDMKQNVDLVVVSHLQQWLRNLYLTFIDHDNNHWLHNVPCVTTPNVTKDTRRATGKVCRAGKRFATVANTILKGSVYDPKFCAVALCFPRCADQYCRQLSTLPDSVIEYSVTPNARDEVPTRIYHMICHGILERVIVPTHKVRDRIHELWKNAAKMRLSYQTIYGGTNAEMIANDMAVQSSQLASWSEILSTAVQHFKNCQKLVDDENRREERERGPGAADKGRKRARNDLTATEYIHGARGPRNVDITDVFGGQQDQ